MAKVGLLLTVITMTSFSTAFYIKDTKIQTLQPIQISPQHQAVYSPHINTPAPEAVTEGPLINTKDWLALWEAIKTKMSDLNPINKFKNLFNSNNSDSSNNKEPEYKFVPAMGFTHYNQIKYYPIVETPNKQAVKLQVPESA